VKRLAVQLLYFARTAVRGLLASPITSGVAVVTIAVSLVLAGAFALLVQNMEELLDRFGSDLHLTAYLEESVSPAEQAELARLAGTVEGVASVRLVSKQEALERFRSGAGPNAALLEGLDENPLPASLDIELVAGERSAEGMRRVLSALDGLPGIADLSSGQDWVEGYLRAVALVRGVGIGLGAILALATLLIVANTIRLAVLARRDELQILALVGASRTFVQTPFLLEGLLEGALAGGLALGFLFTIFRLWLPGLEFGLELLLGGVAPRFFDAAEALTLVGGGAALGVVGSAFALVGGWRS
jgi:cell division transport system permease protein